MQNLLESFKHSPVLQVAESKALDTLNYSIAKSLQFPGELATQKFKVNCNSLASGMLSGSQFSVNIPQYGLLRKAFLRFQIRETGSQNAKLSGCSGIFAFNRITLQTTSGNVISTLYPENIHYKMLQRSDGAKLLAAAGSAAQVTINNATSTLYCPLLFDMFNHPASWLDALSLEELCFTFYCRNSSEYVDLSAAGSAITLASADLILYFAQPTPERHNELLSVKHPGGSSYNYLGFSNFQESVVSQSGATFYSIQMYCPSPVVRTIIAVKDAVATKKLNTLDYAKFVSVRIVDSGNELLFSTAAEITLEAGDADANGYIVINWGLIGQLDPDQKRSGSAVSLYSMSNPTIELTMTDNTARSIIVVHEILQAVSVSSSPNMRNRQITVLSDR